MNGSYFPQHFGPPFGDAPARIQVHPIGGGVGGGILEPALVKICLKSENYPSYQLFIF